MASRNYAERKLHLSVARLLEWTARKDVVWFHVPNEGVRTEKAGALLKALGLKRGVPDIVILTKGHCLGLELKAHGGRLSPDQQDMKQRWLSAGGGYCTANSYEEAFDFLEGAQVLKTTKDARVLPREARVA